LSRFWLRNNWLLICEESLHAGFSWLVWLFFLLLLWI